MKPLSVRLKEARQDADQAIKDAIWWIRNQSGKSDALLKDLENPINLPAIMGVGWAYYHAREHLYAKLSTLREIEIIALKSWAQK